MAQFNLDLPKPFNCFHLQYMCIMLSLLVSLYADLTVDLMVILDIIVYHYWHVKKKLYIKK